MFNMNRTSLISSLAALIILSGMVFCACDTAATGTSSQDTAGQTTETLIQSETSEETSGSSETSETTPAVTTAAETESSSEESSEASSEETKDLTDTDIGYGPYGFQRGSVRFHSQNDISMMIEAEDPTVYDYGARDVFCHWIDIFYVEDSFDMTSFDDSYRFLSFYNDDTSVTFSGYKEIGRWTTPKGSDLELYLAGITIISDNLEINILPKNPSEPDNYTVSVDGRGYYVSEEQLQMTDFVLSCLLENPGTDPLEGIISGVDHTYYF